MAEIYKDGQILYNFIDNDGQSDRSSLGARYAKGRADNTDNNLRLNYFTKEQVYELLDGVAKTYIVSEMPTAPYFILSEDTVAVAGKVYFAVTFVQDADPISPEMANLYERKAFIPPWSQDPQIYYELADPTTWDPATKAYYKVDTVTQREYQEGAAITEVVYTQEPRYPEPNTYYLVGNDTDGYDLYYWDSDLQEAYVGSYDIDLSEYQKKFHENVSPLGNLSDNDKVTWLDFSSNTAWKVMLKDIKAYILDATYPVGSLYMSMDVTFNPATAFGGTWQRIEDRFLLAAGGTHNVVNSFGGKEETTILRSDLPNVNISTSSNGSKQTYIDTCTWKYTQGGQNNKFGMDYGRHEEYMGDLIGNLITASNHTHSFDLNGNVTQTKLNNMPPYVTVMVWKRTA